MREGRLELSRSITRSEQPETQCIQALAYLEELCILRER